MTASTNAIADETIVVGLGELLWDCFGDNRRPGGAPANVAFHAHQLGLQGEVCSRVGNDDLGEELLNYLRQHGLEISYIQQDTGRPTGTVTVHSETADAPSYTIHEEVAWDYLDFDNKWKRLFSEASAVCFGTLAQRTPQNRDTVKQCLDAAGNAMLVYDVNLRPPHYKREWIEGSLKRCHVAKFNIDESKILGDMFGIKASKPEHVARNLIETFEIGTVCITRGNAGCLMARPDETVDQPGVHIDVRDAVGAGDAFTAAMTYGLLAHWPLAEIAPFANHAGALVASRSGAMPVLAEAYDDLKERFAP